MQTHVYSVVLACDLNNHWLLCLVRRKAKQVCPSSAQTVSSPWKSQLNPVNELIKKSIQSVDNQCILAELGSYIQFDSAKMNSTSTRF